MGDPTGLGGAVAGVLLEELITVVKNAMNCKEESQNLLQHLERIQPLVSDAVAHLKRDSSIDANGKIEPGTLHVTVFVNYGVN